MAVMASSREELFSSCYIPIHTVFLLRQHLDKKLFTRYFWRGILTCNVAASFRRGSVTAVLLVSYGRGILRYGSKVRGLAVNGGSSRFGQVLVCEFVGLFGLRLEDSIMK